MEPSINCFILVPGLSDRFRSGGLLVIKDVAKLLKNSGINVEFITTHEICPGAKSPNDFVFKIPNSIFLVTWGPLVEKHIKLIKKHNPNAKIIYYAQSFGWNIKLPPDAPIVCVSRFVMAQWVLRSPENPCAYIPPPLNPCFAFKDVAREIDVLIHIRKQNKYCLSKLLPAIKKEKIRIEAIGDWIPQENFAALLNKTKIFLYITDFHKVGFRRRLPGEGFGLPALEACACGAMVASNLLGGVTDFLTPGENCVKTTGDEIFDVGQILNAIENFRPNKKTAEEIAARYSRATIEAKWHNFLTNL